MPLCTFFGHRDAPASIRGDLYKAICDLVDHCGVDRFLVGNEGSFDRMVFAVLGEVASQRPHIHYEMALAYLPSGSRKLPDEVGVHTLVPNGIETVPRRFAISYRNRWMLERADYVIAYVDHTWGGAWQWYEKAKRMGLCVNNLYQ